MSCDWNVYCLNCREKHFFEDANHQDKLMWLLVRAAKEIAGLKELCENGDVRIETSFGGVDAEWFAKHAGHRLCPISEYGDLQLEQPCTLCGKASRELRLVTFSWEHLACPDCRASADAWLDSRRSKP